METLNNCNCILKQIQIEDLTQALDVAHYALTHPASNQKFAIDVVEQVLSEKIIIPFDNNDSYYS